MGIFDYIINEGIFIINLSHMPNKHLLNLDIPDSNNPYVFTVNDLSIYAQNLGVTCGELLITAPGFNTPVTINVNQGFKLNLSACDLGIQLTGCGTAYNSLPDGIYILRYMIAPLGSVFVEYNYLRMTNVDNVYYNTLSRLEIALQDPGSEVASLLNEMRTIRSFLDAAKAKVEIQHDVTGGSDMLAYAKKRLARIANICY